MRFLGIICLLLPAILSAQPAYKSETKTFDQYIKQGMEDWQVPGLSISVVKDGAVIFNQGYGIQDVESQSNVTTSTRFMIGSTTKAMTAFALALLVDEGQLDWTDRVIDHYTEFQLFDPYVTREVNIIDLLSHRAGLGNADYLWSLNDIPAEEIVERLRLLEPSYPFRDGYTYQNIMYLVAGMVVEKVSGLSWEEFVRQRIFTPLGMDRTRALYSDLSAESDYVKPHYLIDGEPQIIPFLTADSIAPAGSVWSTSEDMTKWMLMLLDSGQYQGKSLLSPASFAPMWESHNFVPEGHFYPTAQLTQPHWTTYGLGWFQHDYRGYKLQFHTGSLPGLTAIIGIVPELDFGVYVFGNLDHAELRHALMYRAIDLFNDLGDRDWSNEFQTLYAGLQSDPEDRIATLEKDRVEGTGHSLLLEDYTGEYSHELFGTVRVSTGSGNDLIARFDNGFEARLTHWHYDTFLGEWTTPYSTPDLFLFDFDTTGKISGLRFNRYHYKRLN